MNYNQLAKSYFLRRALKADGYKIPANPTDIKKLVLKQFDKELSLAEQFAAFEEDKPDLKLLKK